jgi:uncharacterized protein (DUF2141 family)
MHILFLFCTLLILPTNLTEAVIEVEFTGIRTNKGHILVALFKGEEGFPNKNRQAAHWGKIPVVNGKATWKLEGVEPGEYAFSFLHDENDNGKMDYNMIGIPKEGYGFSNDAKGFMGPANYKDAKFELKKGINSFSVKVTYF